MKCLIKKPVCRLVGIGLFGLLAATSNYTYAVNNGDNGNTNNNHKTWICHYPPGNVENPQIISIDQHAWEKHRDLHGDGDLEDQEIEYGEECPPAESLATTTTSCESSSGAGLVFSIDKPLIQESTVIADALNTYDFDSVPNWDKVFRDGQTEYTTVIWEGVGTYEGTGSQVDYPNEFGAADGVGKYLFVRSTVYSTEENPGVTLTFNEEVAYFGFWWSAGDLNNKLQVTLADGSVIDVETDLVWDSEGLIQKLASNSGHMGNPTPRFLNQNSDEPYAYLNLTAKDECSKIVSVRFHGTNFETDNHTVTTELVDPPGTVIPVAPNFGAFGEFNRGEINEHKIDVDENNTGGAE